MKLWMLISELRKIILRATSPDMNQNNTQRAKQYTTSKTIHNEQNNTQRAKQYTTSKTIHNEQNKTKHNNTYLIDQPPKRLFGYTAYSV